MFGFGWRKKSGATARSEGSAETFVEATGGGWGDVPDIMASDGGAHADYVGETLRCASKYALENGVAIGEEFEYRITNIPRGIVSPHEIIFGMMMRAPDFGLVAGFMADEKAQFTRVR